MSFLNGLFSVLSVVFFICLIIGLVKPSIFKLQTRLKAFFVFFLAMIICSAGVSFTMSDEQKEQIEKDQQMAQQEREAASANKTKKEFEEKLKEINFQPYNGMNEKQVASIVDALDFSKNKIAKVELFNDKYLDVTLKVGDAWDDAHILTQSGTTSEAILKSLKEAKVIDLENVRIHVEATLLDQYNNKFQAKIFTLDFDYPEILKLNSENTGLYQEYLRFAKFESSGKVGRDAFNAWCANADNRKWSGNFCY